MKVSEEGRIEELSKLVGGRFKLTVLIQKQARDYYAGGRAFMPSVRNFDELFNFILDEIEQGKITLELPSEAPEILPELDDVTFAEDGQEEAEGPAVAEEAEEAEGPAEAEEAEEAEEPAEAEEAAEPAVAEEAEETEEAAEAAEA